MSFAVYVMDGALDALPQSLPFDAFGKLVDLLEQKLGPDPMAVGKPPDHPELGRVGQVYRDGFQSEGVIYLFSAYFHFFEDENTIGVWEIRLSSEK